MPEIVGGHRPIDPSTAPIPAAALAVASPPTVREPIRDIGARRRGAAPQPPHRASAAADPATLAVDPSLGAGLLDSAPTYVGAENSKAALSGLAVATVRRSSAPGRHRVRAGLRHPRIHRARSGGLGGRAGTISCRTPVSFQPAPSPLTPVGEVWPWLANKWVRVAAACTATTSWKRRRPLRYPQCRPHRPRVAAGHGRRPGADPPQVPWDIAIAEPDRARVLGGGAPHDPTGGAVRYSTTTVGHH